MHRHVRPTPKSTLAHRVGQRAAGVGQVTIEQEDTDLLARCAMRTVGIDAPAS